MLGRVYLPTEYEYLEWDEWECPTCGGGDDRSELNDATICEYEMWRYCRSCDIERFQLPNNVKEEHRKNYSYYD